MARKRTPSPLRISARSFWVWFGGIWLAVGVPFLVIGVFSALAAVDERKRFEVEGVPADGIVLEKWVRTSRSSGSGRSSGSTRHYWVSYRFIAADGQRVEGEVEIGADVWDRLEERGPVRVTYLRGDPQTNRVEGEGGGLLPAAIFSGLGGVFTALGGFVFVRRLGQLRLGRRLRRDGVLTTGTVVEVRPSRLKINNVRQYALRYTYRDHLGRPRTGRFGPLPPEEAESWLVGATGAVRFDRRRPQDSVWLGAGS